jgi:hypothetical protein
MKSTTGNGDSLLFKDVALRDYTLFLYKIFQVGDHDLHLDGFTPQNFARIVANRFYEPLIGGEQFGVFRVFGYRGWVFEISGCCVYFIPHPQSENIGDLYCVGIIDSSELYREVTSSFGVPERADLPNVEPVVWLKRPFKARGWAFPSTNNDFWAIAGDE